MPLLPATHYPNQTVRTAAPACAAAPRGRILLYGSLDNSGYIPGICKKSAQNVISAYESVAQDEIRYWKLRYPIHWSSRVHPDTGRNAQGAYSETRTRGNARSSRAARPHHRFDLSAPFRARIPAGAASRPLDPANWPASTYPIRYIPGARSRWPGSRR